MPSSEPLLTWEALEARIASQYGSASVSEEALLFLIGLHELGFYPEGEDKAVKTQLIQLGGAVLLERAGFLQRTGTDSEGWPTFTRLESLPPANPAEQRRFLRKQILLYFEGLWQENAAPQKPL